MIKENTSYHIDTPVTLEGRKSEQTKKNGILSIK